MEKILTGKDHAEANMARSMREWTTGMAGEMYRKGRFALAFTGKTAPGRAVKARIDHGRWIADCPDCNGAEYVDPDDPFFFCLSCGNASLAWNAREVVFPPRENREAVERAVLERPVAEGFGMLPTERAMHARPVYPGLARSWNPGETAAELRRQHRLCKEMAEAYPHPALPLKGEGKNEEEVKDGV